MHSTKTALRIVGYGAAVYAAIISGESIMTFAYTILTFEAILHAVVRDLVPKEGL